MCKAMSRRGGAAGEFRGDRVWHVGASGGGQSLPRPGCRSTVPDVHPGVTQGLQRCQDRAGHRVQGKGSAPSPQPAAGSPVPPPARGEGSPGVSHAEDISPHMLSVDPAPGPQGPWRGCPPRRPSQAFPTSVSIAMDRQWCVPAAEGGCRGSSGRT